MIRVSISIILLLLSIQTSNSIKEEAKTSLINFITKLSSSNGSEKSDLFSSWNVSSDPCRDRWKGVTCNTLNVFIRKLELQNSDLSGELDFRLLCNSESISNSLTVIHLENNSIRGSISSEILSCRKLTHIHLNSNELSGTLPNSLSTLRELSTLDVSRNKIFGEIPDLSLISALKIFRAQDNEFTGKVPSLDFSSLKRFNVSNNNLDGPVPLGLSGHFTSKSLLGNPGLCGDPLPNQCQVESESKSNNVIRTDSDPESSSNKDSSSSSSSSSSKEQVIMFAGYILLGLVLVLVVVFLFCKKRKRRSKVETELPRKTEEVAEKGQSGSTTITSMEQISESAFFGPSPLVVLTSPEVNGLRFDDLLKAPAEMLGRGENGSAYKVTVENSRKSLVVKRIKNWAISSSEFRHRMKRLDQVKHPNVLPPLAYYSAKQEKLLVYEYQPNGSLFKFIHGKNMSQIFDWTARLSVASSIAEALAFMHAELRDDEIPHGNLKSSNVFLRSSHTEACISEYGLAGATPAPRFASSSRAFKEDVYAFGVLLLEMLTGNLVQHDGVDLADWVNAVVREEWTGEVFDKLLFSECTSEERMVSLLQVAVKCVNKSHEARPSMNQVVVMINAIKDEEEKSAMLSFYDP